MYWTILTIALAERFTYRTDFLFGTLMRFLPIVTTVFLWEAIFAHASGGRIGGYTSGGMISYYLLVLIARAFSSMPGLSGSIAADVREGQIKKYLLQPVDLVGYLLMTRVAHKLVYYSVASLPLAIVFFLCRGYLPGLPSATIFAAFLVTLVMGFAVGFLFETLVGLSSFWILEIASVGSLVMTLSYFLSGHMFPLDLLDGPLRTVVEVLPFKYMAYYPAKIYLHGDEMTARELAWGLAGEAAMVLALFLAVRTALNRGIRRYSAFGG